MSETPMRSSLDGPPMLPTVCHQSDFVLCTDLQAQSHTENVVLVAQLSDSLMCWISYGKELADSFRDVCATIDRTCSTTAQLHILDYYAIMKQQEQGLSFVEHFDKDAVTACLRVLRHVPAKREALLELDALLETLSAMHSLATDACTYLGSLQPFLTTGWTAVEELVDTLPPLFSALRSLWVCSVFFGCQCQNPERFNSVVRWIVVECEAMVTKTVDAVLPAMCDNPATAIKGRARIVASQDAIVTLQECYHSLKATMATECDGAEALILSEIDDDQLFSTADWLYHRLIAVHDVVEHLQHNEDKLGSRLMDRILQHGVTDPIVSDEQFLEEIMEVTGGSAPSAKLIIQRIRAKQQKKEDQWREAERTKKKSLEPDAKNVIVIAQFEPAEITIVGPQMPTRQLIQIEAGVLPMASTKQRAPSKSTPYVDPQFEAVHVAVPNPQHSVVRMKMENYFFEEVRVIGVLHLIQENMQKNGWNMVNSASCIDPATAAEVHMMFFHVAGEEDEEEEAESRRISAAHAELEAAPQPATLGLQNQ